MRQSNRWGIADSSVLGGRCSEDSKGRDLLKLSVALDPLAQWALPYPS